MSNDEITTYLDGAIYFTDDELVVLTEVDDAIEASVARGDPSAVFSLGRRLARGHRIQGIALARLLTKLEDRWALFSNEDFEESAYAEIGIAPATTRKYTQNYRNVIYRLEAMVNEGRINAEVVRRIMGMPIGTLLLLTAGAKEGQFDDKWEEIADTTTQAEVREIVQKARGMQTSANAALKIYISIKGPGRGTLSRRRGDGAYKNIGHLNLDLEDADSQQAIARIMGVGVIER